MAVAEPVAGFFGRYAERYVSRWSGFAVHATYSIIQIIAIGAEVTAMAIYFSLLVPDESAVAWGGHRFFRPDRFQRLAELPVRLRMFPLSNILGILLVLGIAGTSFYVKDLEYSVPVFLPLLSAATLVYWGSRRRFPGHPRANQGGRSSVPEP